ncbi:MAG: hypothetical protein N2508_09380 [Anaerolineae bacterium]|nr:hypothetical protein [Anaerolineae bacterium]
MESLSPVGPFFIGETSFVPTIEMQSFYMSPIMALIYGLIIWFWYIFVGWSGWHWFVRRRRWPWPVVAVLQGLLAAQVYLLTVPLNLLDAECCHGLQLPFVFEVVAGIFFGMPYALPLSIMAPIVQPDWGHGSMLIIMESTAALYTLIYALQHLIMSLIERGRKRKVAASGEVSG